MARHRIPVCVYVWVVIILAFLVLAVVVPAAELTFDSPATVSMCGPRGRVYCVAAQVHWTLTDEGIHARMVVPGPIAGQPWTCHTSRTWESLAEEFERRRDEFADLLIEYGVEKLRALAQRAAP